MAARPAAWASLSHTRPALLTVGLAMPILALDLRVPQSPFARIRGAIEILGRRLPEGGDHTVVPRMLRRVDALNALTKDVLAYARPRLPESAATR